MTRVWLVIALSLQMFGPVASCRAIVHRGDRHYSVEHLGFAWADGRGLQR